MTTTAPVPRRLALAVVGGAAALGVLVQPPDALAYRPLATEDAGVPGKGVAQLEVGVDHLHWRGGDMENAVLFVPIYGVTRDLQVSVETPFRFVDPKEGAGVGGVGDVTVVGKALVHDETPRTPAIALRTSLKTDTGSERRDLGTGTWDLGVVAAATKTFEPVTLHAMLGYTFVLTASDRFQDVHVFGFAADWKVSERWHLVGEVAGNGHPERRAGPDPVSGLAGVIYDVTDTLAVDVGVRRGFNRSLPEWTISTGFSATF